MMKCLCCGLGTSTIKCAACGFNNATINKAAYATLWISVVVLTAPLIWIREYWLTRKSR